MAKQSKHVASDAALSIRLPSEVVRRADALIPVLAEEALKQGFTRMSRSVVLKRALLSGLDALERGRPSGSLRYAWEKLYSAVRGLASDTSSLQERLARAAVALHTLRPDPDLPAELRAEYGMLWRDLTGAPRAGGGSIAAACKTMDDAIAAAKIAIIVDMYDKVASMRGDAEHFRS